MESLRQYILAVVSVALISSILMSLVQNGFAKELIRLICGLFLTLIVIQPIINFDFGVFAEYSASFAKDAEAVAAVGDSMAKEAMGDIIKSESEAYILDKAASMNADITVDITVSDAQLPERATLSGNLSPYARERLETILESDLGITKENQVWTG